MSAKVDFAVCQTFELGRALQFPILATRLNIATGQTTTPVALVQIAIQTEG
ncbi:hypothetical protein D3C72_656890 [compost metagenome]